MWDYDSLLGKAAVYFGRAQAHPHSDDEEFALWSLLGLEFLLRAPLAKIHPSLLAVPEGPSILHANGVLATSEPKSIGLNTALERLQHIIPDFDKDVQRDAKVLIALRNAELHTGEAALGSIAVDLWLPIFTRVSEVLCKHLNLGLEDLIGDELATLGRALVDDADKKLHHEIQVKVQAAKSFAEQLTDVEVVGRTPDLSNVSPIVAEVVDCPGCGLGARLELTLTRTTDERVEEDEFVFDRVLVATGLACSVCNLLLSGTAEVKAAGLPQHFMRTVRESFYDRMQQQYMEDEYGND